MGGPHGAPGRVRPPGGSGGGPRWSRGSLAARGGRRPHWLEQRCQGSSCGEGRKLSASGGPQPLPGPHPRGSLDPAEGSEAGGGGGAAFGGGALSGLPGEAREAGGGATHRSEASSLLMYSSRMLVSMLEGSRAPLMSWPAGRSGREPGHPAPPPPVSTWRESPSLSPPAAPPAGRDAAAPSPQGPLDCPQEGRGPQSASGQTHRLLPLHPLSQTRDTSKSLRLSVKWGERVPVLWGAVSSR